MFGKPDPPALPTAPAAPPAFGSSAPPKRQNKQPGATPTFLGGDAGSNPTNTGQKTLLGQ